ncbi:hypothetical protein BUALT_Bualt06G0118000 [Buddleja alternifolia]|uniref:LysM domain-containing protein n=1 Tax=Buddleja alternifolia TaxID=168488 RepID=A0AAV6XQJ3_9LAMI|nr:hypothetical protein BUALT_Bualt06G0118000 [Buddleja alternifolia]
MAPSKHKYIKTSILVIADAASFCCAVAFIALILLSFIYDGVSNEPVIRGRRFVDRPCDEIYVVGEGETLNTISEKCCDPYIVERNPHIHDPDDVFPGLVIKIVPETLN